MFWREFMMVMKDRPVPYNAFLALQYSTTSESSFWTCNKHSDARFLALVIAYVLVLPKRPNSEPFSEC